MYRRLRNDGPGLHHVQLVRLAGGRAPADLVQQLAARNFRPPWASFVGGAEGPKPGDLIGGTAGIAPGGMNFVTADFSAGEYALLCFVPDATDSKSHVAHGMVRQIRVE